MSEGKTKNKYEIDMCNGTIMDKLITFSVPLMLSSVLQLMFNAVDIIVVGRFSGSQALAAVGSTTALINIFVNLFIGISLGANVLAARFYALEMRKEMSERKMKRVEDSLTEQSHLLMPKCLNAAGYLFGGQLLAWIDETAGIVAKRHAEMNVVTVAVDNMYFKAGARVNDTIVLIGRLTHVGRSSMEVRIDTYCEALDGTRTMINRAYFIMVGTDEHQHPVEVPGLILEGVTQQIENEAAQKRAKLWKVRRQEGF